MKFVYTLVSLLFVSVAIANPADSVRSEQRDEGVFVVHEVEEDDTIYSLARRYGSSVLSITKYNQIVDNQIDIGQVIYVLVEKEKPNEAVPVVPIDSSNQNIHIVQPGETLYSISRKYDVKLKQLKKLNSLVNNDLSPGMQLRLNDEAEIVEQEDQQDSAPSEAVDLEEEVAETNTIQDSFADFEKYLVQTGETLSTIARKIEVSIDSLKIWNGLNSDYLKIGQELFFKKNADLSKEELNEPTKNTRTQIDEKGFERIYEEGMTSVIESMKTNRFLALHQTLPIGTNLKVRNLMNNQVVHVKVVGKLPNTGLNKGLLLRISQPAYDQLGILDSKSRVEVSYSKK